MTTALNWIAFFLFYVGSIFLIFYSIISYGRDSNSCLRLDSLKKRKK